MNGTPPPLFGLPRIIADVRGKLGDWDLRGLLKGVPVLLLFGWLSRILARMERLAAAYQAGTLRRRGIAAAEGSAAR